MNRIHLFFSVIFISSALYGMENKQLLEKEIAEREQAILRNSSSNYGLFQQIELDNLKILQAALRKAQQHGTVKRQGEKNDEHNK